MHAYVCVCVCALTFCVRCVIVCASRAALMRISSSRTRRSSRSAVVCCLQREREEREGEGGKRARARVCVCVCGKCTTQRLARQTSSFERRAWSSSCALSASMVRLSVCSFSCMSSSTAAVDSAGTTQRGNGFSGTALHSHRLLRHTHTHTHTHTHIHTHTHRVSLFCAGVRLTFACLCLAPLCHSPLLLCLPWTKACRGEDYWGRVAALCVCVCLHISVGVCALP